VTILLFSNISFRYLAFSFIYNVISRYAGSFKIHTLLNVIYLTYLEELECLFSPLWSSYLPYVQTDVWYRKLKNKANLPVNITTGTTDIVPARPESLLLLRLVLYLHVSKGPSEPRSPHCRSFTITLVHTALVRTPLDE